MKRKLIVAAFTGFVLLLVGGIVMDAHRFPMPQATRVGDDQIAGIEAGGSMAWVLATKTGVVLVDAGWDLEATALKKEVAGRKVHAILITHGHFDHVAALPAFPDARVIVGPGESALVQGKAAELGWMSGMVSAMMAPAPFVPSTITEFRNGEVLEIDGASIRALHTPGHTHGSAMYIYKDVVFTGDTVVGRGDAVNEMPSGSYTNYDIVRAGLRKVMDYPFERVADGHVGLHKNARQQVQAFLNAD
jgi:glyoxylase-like metal-dependent hydrolase (beta-lactamase superfamily II)